MAGRRQRKAALPAGGYTRPASIDATGLVVTVYGEGGGVEGVFDFTALAGSAAVRRAFAAAFDRKSGPGGTWRSVETCRNEYRSIQVFLRWLDARDHQPRTPSEISAAMWASWRLSLPHARAGHNHLANLRVIMPEVRGIPAETLKAAGRRIPQAPSPTEAACTFQEFSQIRTAAATVFSTALVRIRANREHLRRWPAGEYAQGSRDWLIGEALDCLVRTADLPLAGAGGPGRRVRAAHERALGGLGPERTWGRLYLTQPEIAAAVVLLTASEGWNRSVLHTMRIPQHDPAAAEDFDIHMVEVGKRRRPIRLRYAANNLADSGPGTPGRLMGQVIEATEMARQTLDLLGRPTDRLLVSRLKYPRKGHLLVLGMPDGHRVRTSLKDDQGEPIHVSLRRLRRTVQVLIRKVPAQNSQETHDSVYVLRDPATQKEATATVTKGLADALDHARVTVRMRVMLGGDAGRLIELSDDPQLARAIGNGDLDTATGACTDFTNSPCAAPGLPCSASFLLCLACRNSVATRRHLPRLVYPHEVLSELRAVLSAAVWAQDWHEHFLRVSSLLDTHTTPAERARARDEVSEADRSLIDRLLRRRLDA
jgi:hypothetical protein